ncbi:hypothetical protein ACQPW3_15345 [Actinosynnema sp. CA-248983]
MIFAVAVAVAGLRAGHLRGVVLVLQLSRAVVLPASWARAPSLATLCLLRT